MTQTTRPPLNLAWLLPFAAALLLFIPSAHAQVEHKGPAASIALAASLTAYDVVSVKQHISDGSGDDFTSFGLEPYGFTASNLPLKQILELAYDVKDDQVLGLSGPVNSTRFDIQAKVLPSEGGAPPKLNGSQVTAMLIPLLADRFRLTAHLETKTLPVYELVVARSGPKFQLSQTEAPGGGGFGGKGANRSFNITGSSMADLAAMLCDQAHRKVIDKTGLAGRADISLKWSDDVAALQSGSNVVSIFTAIEEQLGLKLQPSQGPVDTLVIDHAEMPTAD